MKLFMFSTCFLSSHSDLVLAVSMSFAPTSSGPTGHTSIQEQRERWEKKHNLTAVELLQTERRYCEQLELVTTVGIPATTSSITMWTESLIGQKKISIFMVTIINSKGLSATNSDDHVC